MGARGIPENSVDNALLAGAAAATHEIPICSPLVFQLWIESSRERDGLKVESLSGLYDTLTHVLGCYRGTFPRPPPPNTMGLVSFPSLTQLRNEAFDSPPLFRHGE